MLLFTQSNISGSFASNSDADKYRMSYIDMNENEKIKKIHSSIDID